MSCQGDFGDGQPPQYPQDYGRQYPQDKPGQPQENDPFAYAQNPGDQQHSQQVPPWPGPQGGQQPPNQPWSPQPQPKPKAWPARHKVLTGLMAVGALIVIIVATSASNKPSIPVADTGVATNSASPSAAASSAAASPSAVASSASAVASTAPSAPAAPASPAMTTAQEQAVDSAQSYLSEGQGFSEQGLLNQLTSSYGSGFAAPDAEFAIRYLNPDWDQQAVDSAQSYLTEGQGFSEQGLIQQLTSSSGSGFTLAQAEYAIDHVSADWDAQAVDAAKGYMQMGGFSQESLIQQLTSSAGNGFTLAQAEYAASQVGL